MPSADAPRRGRSFSGPAPAVTGSAEIVALTSLRGIAALSVCLFHTMITLIWTLREWYLPSNLYLWVDFFFILSGFVLMHVYGASVASRASGVLRGFFVARFARVYPLHFVVLSAFVLLELIYLALQSLGYSGTGRLLFRDYTDPLQLPAHYLLLQSWGWSRPLGWNMPAWTISAEMAAYLAFPLLVRWGLSRGRLMHALLFAGAFIGITLIALHYGTLDRTGRVGIVRCLTEFTIGCLLYRYAPAILQQLRRGLRRWLELPVVLAVIALMIPGTPQVLVVPVFCLAILLVIAPGSSLAGVLQTRPLHWLGEISYSVYLVHMLVVSILNGYLWVHRPEFLASSVTPPLLIGGVLLVVVVLADRSYRWVELPARRALRRRLGA